MCSIRYFEKIKFFSQPCEVYVICIETVISKNTFILVILLYMKTICKTVTEIVICKAEFKTESSPTILYFNAPLLSTSPRIRKTLR